MIMNSQLWGLVLTQMKIEVNKMEEKIFYGLAGIISDEYHYFHIRLNDSPIVEEWLADIADKYLHKNIKIHIQIEEMPKW